MGIFIKGIFVITIIVVLVCGCESVNYYYEYQYLMNDMSKVNWKYSIPVSEKGAFRSSLTLKCKVQMLRYLKTASKRENIICEGDDDCSKVFFPCFGCSIAINSRARKYFENLNLEMSDCLSQCPLMKCMPVSIICKNKSCETEVNISN
jgi:hypothetical protein